MLLSNVEEMVTTSTVSGQQKESGSKIQVPCRNIMKMYSKGLGGVDLIDQRAVIWIEN